MNGLYTIQSRMSVIDDEEQGQRLDNFLIRRCKGVPKSQIHRILRVVVKCG